MDNQNTDNLFMTRAIERAHSAARRGEVPVGAVITLHDEIIGMGANSPIANHDPTAHAEIIALRSAAQAQKNYRLPHTTLYVTLEPCIMCMGAIIQARIQRLVFGAFDPKSGAALSRYTVGNDALLNHELEISSGVCETECSNLLKAFFRERRRKNRK
jgi:tRNA(adenine34) deaminase